LRLLKHTAKSISDGGQTCGSATISREESLGFAGEALRAKEPKVWFHGVFRAICTMNVV
jgi:hypothetical protein